MRIKVYFFLIAALITICTGCKKDKAEKPGCRISKIINAAGGEIKITYNVEGKYAKIENAISNTTITPAYSPGSIICTVVNSSTAEVRQKITVLLNNSGMASSIRRESYNSAGTITSWANNLCEYSGTELIKDTYTSSSGSSTTGISTFGWTNGNLTSIHEGNSVTSVFEYYTDKPIQQGDYFSILGLIVTGFDYSLYRKNKNLLKTQTNNQYVYGFNAEGKINAIYENGNLLYFLEYECN